MTDATTLPAALKPEAKKVEETKAQRKIHPSRFKLAQHARNAWFITPAQGTPPEAVLDPAFWAHVAERLRPADRIEVHAEDGSWYMELLVRSTGKLSATVAVLSRKDFDPADLPASGPEYDVVWKGPHHKWAVVRLKDKATIQPGFDNRETGTAWLAANLKTLA